ncbi:MAG: helix-turn-helix domain-containing protein [Geminicoccaceae bacterium]
MPLLLTKKQAAEQLGISRDVLLRLLNRGEICVVLIEGTERIPYVDLERFVERRMEFRPPLPVVALPPIPPPRMKGARKSAAPGTSAGAPPSERYCIGATGERWLPGSGEIPPTRAKKTART